MEMRNLTAEANWEYILHVSNPSSRDEGEQPRAAGCLYPGIAATQTGADYSEVVSELW